MKKVLFLVSHLCSGSDQLYEQLCQNITIQGYQNKTNHNYSSMIDIMSLTANKHKLKTTSRIYMDHLLYNFQFSCREAYKHCKFIYFVREPINTIETLVKRQTFPKREAIHYYLFRLRRICEMAKRSKDFTVVTFNNLKNGHGIDDLKSFLGVKEKIAIELYDKKSSGKDILSYKEIELLDKSYEKYLFFLNKISN